LFFYGSKVQEGVGAGCILIDPEENQNIISCHLEFKCTNNIIEYEALVKNPEEGYWPKGKIPTSFG
jgi:ribonuclease HI